MSASEKPANSSQSHKKSGGSSASIPSIEPRPDPPLPRPFGRLTLLKQIARGGMGEVFLATTGGIEGAERPCVVKIIRREHSEDRSFLSRFLDEARIQAQLQHPGVAQILEAAIDPSGKPFVVMEYVEGRNLGELRTRAVQLGARIGWPDAVALGVLLAEALAHVHERTDAAGRPLEIVHRDLSPQNIMVGYNGELKLIDFGTARGENRRCHTVSGIVFAKPGYVAPEVANNNPGGAPADIYAFGIMLWELLAGRRFLTGDPSEHLAEVGAGRRNPTPLAEATDVPSELDTIVSRMTAARLDERYVSARDVATDLAQLLKRAPSLADGERSVRARISHLVRRLYPAEPARSRAEFARLVAVARRLVPEAQPTPQSPTPAPQSGHPPALLPGTRYRLVRELGRGGMGVVYEAYHVDLSRAVALKVLPKERAASPQFAERFRAEARAIARLVHENLVGLHDFGLSSDNRPYYAMELLDGESLEQHLEREKGMDWREAARLACQACDALQVAHDAGVIHRDIKPANLFVTRSGTVKLLDFGIAAIDEPSESWDGHSGALSVVGTPEYMAPEQVRRQPCDARTDVYSLGTVLYELVTGGLPFSASNTVALLDAKTRTDPEPARQRAPERGLPIMLDKTIQRAVARDPAQRFQSAGELRQALVETLREPIRTRQRRRGIALAGLGVLALSFAATAAVGVMSPEIRARALAMVQPVLQKAHALRARAIASGATAATPEADGGQRPAEPAAAPAQGDKPSSGAAPDPAASETVGGTPTDEADGEPAAALVAAEQERSGAAADNVAPGDAQPEPLEDAFAAQPVSEATADDQVQAQIEQAAELMQQGARIKAFNLYRRAGQQHPEDPRALKAWSQAAVVMNGWGEAYRVASRWAEVDQSVEARVHLARMQRAVGKREAAMKTLAQLLEEHPRCAEAQQLLGLMTGKARVAMQ